jgi:hypothetical protein
VIASGAPLTFSNFGSGYSVPATTATISNGTGGTCSGPAGAVTVTTATAEASNRAQIYAGLQGKSFPPPAFGAQLIALTDVAVGYIQIHASTGSIFNSTQAENEVDMLAQKPPNGLGVSVIQINFDPYYWIDNTGSVGCTSCSSAFRTLFQAVMTYIYTHYGASNTFNNPVVSVRLEPSYASNNLSAVCMTLTGQTTFAQPSDLANCVTATPAISAPWLTFGATTYGVYEYLAKVYGPSATGAGAMPILSDFTDLHEPTTINNNSNFNWGPTPGSGTGTPANWQGAFNTMATKVNGIDIHLNNGIAFDRYESGYASAMLSAGLTDIVYVGGDEYTTGINNSPTCPVTAAALCGDMGNIASILSLAAGSPYNLRVLFTESWLPSWGPGSWGRTATPTRDSATATGRRSISFARHLRQRQCGRAPTA